MLRCSSADCPECESVCVSWRGEGAAGVGALGRSLCPTAEADPAGPAPGQAGHGEAVPGGEEMPGPNSSYIYLTLTATFLLRTEKVAEQSISQPAQVNGLSVTSMVNRGVKKGRGGPG